MNWAIWGLAVFAALGVAWTYAAFRARAGLGAMALGLAHLLVAGLHAAAPVRGLFDPAYAGYGFGFIGAESGLMVAALAGGVFILATVAAFNALWRNRRAQLRTALVSTVFAVNLGGSLALDAARDANAGAIQFGDYLTIPGAAGIVLIGVLLVAPFAAGSVATWRRALSPA
jgi:hypothetical protein